MEDIEKIVFKSTMNFIMDSHMKLMEYGVDSKDLRIAFPQYLKQYFIAGAYHNNYNHNFDIDTIQGIKTHPTWENAITLYSIDCVLNRNLLIYKMSFLTEYKEYGLTNKVIINFADHFNFAL